MAQNFPTRRLILTFLIALFLGGLSALLVLRKLEVERVGAGYPPTWPSRFPGKTSWQMIKALRK